MTPLTHPGPLSAAERARKHRQREREGLQYLGIDVPHAVIELLIAERYLTEPDAVDRPAIEKQSKHSSPIRLGSDSGRPEVGSWG